MKIFTTGCVGMMNYVYKQQIRKELRAIDNLYRNRTGPIMIISSGDQNINHQCNMTAKSLGWKISEHYCEHNSFCEEKDVNDWSTLDQEILDLCAPNIIIAFGDRPSDDLCDCWDRIDKYKRNGGVIEIMKLVQLRSE